jgi:flagellar biosynthesis protein FlhG
MTETTIIPIASGKGGVGKSIFAANLAIALAQSGRETVAVDLDLGGSNLYTCLGIANTHPGIGDFLKAGRVSFPDLYVSTPVDHLRFIPGDGRTPFMANISYEQRLTLLREIRKIPARYVILDLGAGTVFNTLNFFGTSYKGIIITTFETPSIMNFINFLRNFIFRVIAGTVRQNKSVLQALISDFQKPIEHAPTTIRSLIRTIETVDPALARAAAMAVSKYRPRIVFNMGDHPDELKILPKLDKTIRQGLSIEVEFMGFIFNDDRVRRAAKNRKVLLTEYPDTPAARGIRHIADRVIRTWHLPMEKRWGRLEEDTRRQYSEWKA